MRYVTGGDLRNRLKWFLNAMVLVLVFVLAFSIGVTSVSSEGRGDFVSMVISDGFGRLDLYAITSGGECFVSVDGAKTWKYCGNILFWKIRFSEMR